MNVFGVINNRQVNAMDEVTSKLFYGHYATDHAVSESTKVWVGLDGIKNRIKENLCCHR